MLGTGHRAPRVFTHAAALKGDYSMSRPPIQIEERFWDNVVPDPNSGCWHWMGTLNAAGYAVFWDNAAQTTIRAHRFAYNLFKGVIPEGLEPDHLCREKSCVNPDHLEAVTHQINVLRSAGPAARNAVKTHCPAGHPYSGENLYEHKTGRGCKICRRRNRDNHLKRQKYALP